MLHRRKRRLRRQALRFFFFLLSFTGLLYFFITNYIFPKKEVLHLEVTPTKAYATPTSLSQSTKLDGVVSAELDGTKGKYAIFIKDLKNGEVYSRNPDVEFESASLYKLWIMAVVFQKIEEGDLKMDTVLSQDVKVLNDKFNIATESAERTEGKVSSTVEDALFKMITISDNYSALLLTAKIRLSSVTSFLESEGYTHSKVGGASTNPETSASDMALFLERLYKGEIVSKSASEEMIKLLKEQRLNNKLPKDLPKEAVVAHKTGELGAFTHDAGIVYTDDPYIIVAMSESSNPAQAEIRIAGVSSAVYQYFTTKK